MEATWCHHFYGELMEILLK